MKLDFDEFASRIRPEALIYAKRLTRNADDAADLVQDTLLRAYDSIRRNGGTPGKAWFKTIMQRRQIDLRRAKKCRIQTTSIDTLCSIDSEFEVPFADPGFDRVVDRAIVEDFLRSHAGSIRGRRQRRLQAAMNACFGRRLLSEARARA